jgi:biopolymer transport protein ExbB/TolQ
MTRTQPSASADRQARRSGANVIAFVVGLPLAAAVIGVVLSGVLHNTPLADLERYLGHTVEWVEVAMACVALSGLGAKLWATRREKAALTAELLPAWDGKPVPIRAVDGLLADFDRQPRRWHNTYLGRRIVGVLDFIRSRGSANELDDQLRSLADLDSLTLEGSYALIRFITWAVPILGFLGTVLGITQSIAHISPEQLEKDLGSVTNGLALAFDATALALGMTMVVMFVSYLAERAEQGVLEAVDAFADRQLAHRFERHSGEGGAVVNLLREQSHELMQTTETLVKHQAAIWAKAMEETERRRVEAEQQMHKRLSGGLETALEQTLETHAKRLAALEKQNAGQTTVLLEKLGALASAIRDAGREQHTQLARIAQGLSAQAETLAHLQADEKQLVQLQDLLQQNLNTLASAGAFEQAVHSLTAAIHLMTLHSGAKHPELRIHGRPGTAA